MRPPKSFGPLPRLLALTALALGGCIQLPDELPAPRFSADGGEDAESTPLDADRAVDALADGGSGDAQPSAEVCNGVDDDGDEAVDEGVRNACGACGAVPPERCDGFDNDCDLIVDEEASCTCAPGADEVCGVDEGRCVAGRRSCDDGGAWGPCSAVGPEDEVCNGEDDDCDGTADEGVQNRCGACGPLPDEVCNGIDDDCDGVVDGVERAGALCPCPLGDRRPCGESRGRCRRGTETCSPQGWGACEGAIGPSDELCNGDDDDCDGAADEDWPRRGQACTEGVGACRANGAFVCAADGRAVQCSAQAGGPTNEVCNGVDDDCDGRLDEVPVNGPCETGEPGICAAGTARCVAGEPLCSAIRAPEAEQCNTQDDDCDGRADEDFDVVVVPTTYAALRDVQPGCRERSDEVTPACNSATHRLCRDRPCGRTGVGPVEALGDAATVVCLSDADVHQVPYAVLSGLVPTCVYASNRAGTQCAMAVHAWCSQQGYVSGFGPIEGTPESMFVACIGEVAVPVMVDYATLAQHHAGCRAGDDRDRLDCKAAINRFCVSRGHVSGYGPVNMGQEETWILCLSP